MKVSSILAYLVVIYSASCVAGSASSNVCCHKEAPRSALTIKNSVWAHGSSLHLQVFQESLWSVYREAGFATVRPPVGGGANSGWVHIPISTPNIINDVRSRASAVSIRFTTGPLASIAKVGLTDGDTNTLLRVEGVDYRGSQTVVKLDVPNTPEVNWGLIVTLGVNFSGSGDDAYIRIASAGVGFV